MRTTFLRALFTLFIGGDLLAAEQQFLPENTLFLEDNKDKVGLEIEEATFNKIIDTVTAPFEGLASSHGAQLVVEKLWDDPTVNAQATQDESIWTVRFFGGLARRPEITKDGFALIVCHELGHHFGGYPFIFEWGPWPLSVEGNADYYATHYCLRSLWEGQDNSEYGNTVPKPLKTKCDQTWNDKATRDLCYRISLAGFSAADLSSKLNDEPLSIDATDPEEASGTLNWHPVAQCRFDTYVAGALCKVPFNPQIIPGKDHPSGQRSADAMNEAMRVSCPDSTVGSRPKCWFDPNDVW
ncbi:MAG: hypothetical protein AB7T49_07970 [Oligoflexales bacterium]